MGRRAIVLFWGAVAAAVFFLGSVWTTAGHLGSGPHTLANAAVTGRIAFVLGRAQRRARLRRSGEPIRMAGQDV